MLVCVQRMHGKQHQTPGRQPVQSVAVVQHRREVEGGGSGKGGGLMERGVTVQCHHRVQYNKIDKNVFLEH